MNLSQLATQLNDAHGRKKVASKGSEFYGANETANAQLSIEVIPDTPGIISISITLSRRPGTTGAEPRRMGVRLICFESGTTAVEDFTSDGMLVLFDIQDKAYRVQFFAA